MYRLLFLFVVLTFIFGCVEPPDYPVEPEIKFVSMSKQYLKQGSQNEDTLFVQFSFTDGDGDLGSDGEQESPNVFLIDSRDGFEGNTYKLPMVPTEGAGNGISGTVDLKLYTSCCLFDDGTGPCGLSASKTQDTLYYTLYIEDRAGHKSNEIEVGPIYLLCE